MTTNRIDIGGRSVPIAELKAHLSAEIRYVREGGTVTVLDHRKPVARLTGISSGIAYSRRRTHPFRWVDLEPLVSGPIEDLIDEERADSW